MINVVEQVLKKLEARTATPSTIQRAADLLRVGIEHGFSTTLVREIQEIRLARAVRYAYNQSPFYHHCFNRAGLQPEDVATPKDLQRLPFTTGDELRDWRRFLCVPPEDLAAVFTTSGTTGEPKQIYFTFSELHMLTNISALALRVRHTTRLQTIVALPMRHGLWIGSASAQEIVRRAGGIPYPVGAGDPQETLKWMRRFDCNTVMSSPSYMTNLTRQAQKEGYHRPLEKILLGGEMLTEDQQQLFHDYWGATVFDSYGSTEMGGAQSISLPSCEGFYLNDMHLYAEIVDAETGAPADEGEFVFTTLTREAFPLLRYRSGDRARWVECDDQLPFRTFEILGRLDDMIVAGDLNLYAAVIADAITDSLGVESRLRILVDRIEHTDHLTLVVAAENATPEGVRRALFSAYPEAEDAVEHGNLSLDVKTGVALEGQIKQLKVVDRRF